MKRMAKHILLFGLTFFFGINSVSNTKPLVQREIDHETTELKAAVNELMTASFRSDHTAISQMISPPPADYYSMKNVCNQIIVENSNLASPPKYPFGVRSELDESKVRFFRESVEQFSSKVGENSLTEIRFDEIRETGTHAVVRIQYGAPRNVVYNGYVLLTKASSGWKVFMIDDGSYLGFDNEYFSQKTCSEPPVTTLAWDPVTY